MTDSVTGRTTALLEKYLQISSCTPSGSNKITTFTASRALHQSALLGMIDCLDLQTLDISEELTYSINTIANKGENPFLGMIVCAPLIDFLKHAVFWSAFLLFCGSAGISEFQDWSSPLGAA